MMDAWFSPQAAQAFSYLSLLSLMALMAVWVKQGKHRSIVLGSFYASIGLGIVFLVAAFAAWTVEQPLYVSGSLALTGFVITAVFAATLPAIYKGYAAADQRRMLAKDI